MSSPPFIVHQPLAGGKYSWSSASIDSGSDINDAAIKTFVDNSSKCCCILTFLTCLPFCLFIPFERRAVEINLKSQKLEISGTTLKMEYSQAEIGNCYDEKVFKLEEDLKNIRAINLSVNYSSQLWSGAMKIIGHRIVFVKGSYPESTRYELFGFQTDRVPREIRDVIIRSRPTKKQNKSLQIPKIQISGEQNSNLFSVDPEFGSVTASYKSYEDATTTFVDSLGDIVVPEGPPALQIWSPPKGRPRGGSGDGPELMTYAFATKDAALECKQTLEDIRDSFL